MGDSLTPIQIRAAGHSFVKETSTVQYSKKPPETKFVWKVFVILSRAKWCLSGIYKPLVDRFTSVKTVNSKM